jgi:hypothetical protein
VTESCGAALSEPNSCAGAETASDDKSDDSDSDSDASNLDTQDVESSTYSSSNEQEEITFDLPVEPKYVMSFDAAHVPSPSRNDVFPPPAAKSQPKLRDVWDDTGYESDDSVINTTEQDDGSAEPSFFHMPQIFIT